MTSGEQWLVGSTLRSRLLRASPAMKTAQFLEDYRCSTETLLRQKVADLRLNAGAPRSANPVEIGL
jgi:hypothetical protein